MSNENSEILDSNEQLETLDTEVKKFADKLPYWEKYLANNILTGVTITETEIDTAFDYLMEELKIIPTTEKIPISINYTSANFENYKSDNLFAKLDNVEGVNALIENQTIEFSPNLTIIYGANGSGKSGYVRLLKKAFYSKAPEEILKNIHLDTGHKPVSARFSFKSSGTITSVKFPDSSQDSAFNQFAVFDGKSALRHLEQRNEFEFRPAGLGFFSEFNEAVKKIETKLNTEIDKRNSSNDFADLFDGESEIKTIIQNLNENSKISELRGYLPYSEADKAKRKEIDKDYDELLLASKGKDKEIKNLENIKHLLLDSKRNIETLNGYFTQDRLSQLKESINDCISKEEVAKNEGVGNFKTDKIQGIGTNEWKSFIISAQQFALKQDKEGSLYPQSEDNCLFCHQQLSSDAQQLILKYWLFIKSVAEENSKSANGIISQLKADYEKLNFDLFPIDNTLTNWYYENYPEPMEMVESRLYDQILLSQKIISDLNSKTTENYKPIRISTFYNDEIVKLIDAKIKVLQSDRQNEELAKLLKAKTKLAHKEKLELHFDKFELYITNRQWISKANSISWISVKRNITDTEKSLSSKYFNKKYIDEFNQECIALKGDFGISIDSKGSGGKSNRQLLIKGNSPSAILSEGEQKVIALADFLAEMKMSEINRGLIFDDPVSSLDNHRKKEIAERLAIQATFKQVIIFTHDLVFFYHIKNFCKKYLNGISNSLVYHSLERESSFCGKVVANTSPANEGQYNEPVKAEEWLRKSKTANGNDKTDYSKAGLSALRSSYEALAIFTILGGTVQRFDPQIRMGRLKDIKYNKALVEIVVEKHGEISDLIEGHLPSDEFGIIPSPEILEQQINDFKELKQKLKEQ